MFKSKVSETISFPESSLILFFQGKGNSTSFALSLLKSNHDFKNIGYLYSEYLSSSVSYSSDINSLLFFELSSYSISRLDIFNSSIDTTR